MVLGLSLKSFTEFHVIISLIGVASGLVVLYGMLHSKRLPWVTALFLATTVLTSLTGFLFPVSGFTPAIGVGIVSTFVLGAALLALYAFDLDGAWRWIYVVAAIAALWLNVFVLIVQSFQKVAFLHQFAPTGSEPALAIVQIILLAIFVVLGFLAVRRFQPQLAA